MPVNDLGRCGSRDPKLHAKNGHRDKSGYHGVQTSLQVATVRNQVALSLFTDFENYTKFKPAAYHEKSLSQMLDQLITWSGALKALRQ